MTLGGCRLWQHWASERAVLPQFAGRFDRIRENERDLCARGVAHAALFGSRARDDNRADSDTDIMIDIDPAAEATMSVYDYVGLRRHIASLFDAR